MDIDKLMREMFDRLIELYGSVEAAFADWRAGEIENLADLGDDDVIDLVFN